MCASITKCEEVEFEVSIDEFDTDDIIDYLESEGYVVIEKDTSKNSTNDKFGDLKYKYIDRERFKEELLGMLGLGHWVTKERIMNEVEQML